MRNTSAAHEMPQEQSTPVGGPSPSKLILLSLLVTLVVCPASSAQAATITFRTFEEATTCPRTTVDAATGGNFVYACLGDTVSQRGIFDGSGLNLGSAVTGSAVLLAQTSFLDSITLTGEPTGTPLILRMDFTLDGTGGGSLQAANITGNCGGGGVPDFQFFSDSTTLSLYSPFCAGVSDRLQVDFLIGTGDNYYDSLRLTGVEVLDANLQSVPSAGVISEAGLVYPLSNGPTTPVPEPGTLVLVGAGLAAVVRRFRSAVL